MKMPKLVFAIAGGTLAVAVSSAAAVHGQWFTGTKQKPTAIVRPRGPADALPQTAANAAREHGLDVSESRRVGEGTYLVPKGNDLCLIGIRGNEMTGGCSPSDAFFSTSPLNVGVYQQGAPSAAKSVTIAGVAATSVSTVRVMFGDLARVVRVSSSGGFEYTADAAALAAGSPNAVVALDAAGRVIGTQKLDAG